MNYLNQDHQMLRASDAKRAFAVREVLSRALRHSYSFRLQFDRQRLEGVIGSAELQRLMPDLPAPQSGSRDYEVYEVQTDSAKNEILLRILSLTGEGYAELPLTYVRSVRLLDERGATVLRSGDRNSFILFSLPDPEQIALLKEYAQHGIPAEVIEQVEVDMERLQP